ncbi:glycerol kinase, partial [Extibacter muris]|nr:glycerol kinase [Extibacter muris]
EAAVQVPDSEELSGIGPAYAAGLALGVWDESIFDRLKRVKYEPRMDSAVRDRKYQGWKSAVGTILTR